MVTYIVSEDGINLIKAWEGIVDGDPSTVLLEPYLDPIGLPTIGWGHLVKANEDFGDGISLEDADRLLRFDAAHMANAVRSSISRTDLSQKQFDSLVSFSFNVGHQNFKTSTLLLWVNAGDRDLKIPQQFTKWVNAGGRPFKGLARRRLAEASMWIEGC